MQRLPNPGIVPTSQEGGGTVHDNSLAMSAPGSQPGFDAGSMSYPVSTDAPKPVMAAPIPVSDEKDRTSAEAGVPGNAGLWKKTPSAN